MTRPIFEPSTSRTEAKLGFGSNQLFRRPAPPSETGVMDSAWMVQNGGQTILNNSTTNITGYDDQFDGTGITGDMTTGKFELTELGIYLLQLNVLWSGTFVGGKLARISCNGGGQLQQIPNPSNSTTMQDTGTNDDFVQVQFLVFIFDISSPGIVNFQGQVRQNSGVSQDLSTVDFSIVRLSDYVGP